MGQVDGKIQFQDTFPVKDLGWVFLRIPTKGFPLESMTNKFINHEGRYHLVFQVFLKIMSE